MGWETRQRGGLYYVQKRRIGGKVVSEYIGSGPLGGLAATLDAHTREGEQETQAKRQQEWQALLDQDASVAAFYGEVETRLRQALQAAGYHRHARGKWRKRRGNGH